MFHVEHFRKEMRLDSFFHMPLGRKTQVFARSNSGSAGKIAETRRKMFHVEHCASAGMEIRTAHSDYSWRYI